MPFNQAKTPQEYALNLLKMRDRSVGEIKQKMRLKKFSDSEIAETVASLTTHKFLNDEKFARNYVRNQLLIKPQGKFKLRARLIKLYLAPDIIESTLAEISSESEKKQAREAGQSWLRKKKIEPEEQYEKLARYLSSRGFGWEVTKDTIDQLLK